MGRLRAIVLGEIILTPLFILGTWVGDFVQGRPKRASWTVDTRKAKDGTT